MKIEEIRKIKVSYPGISNYPKARKARIFRRSQDFFFTSEEDGEGIKDGIRSILKINIYIDIPIIIVMIIFIITDLGILIQSFYGNCGDLYLMEIIHFCIKPLQDY